MQRPLHSTKSTGWVPVSKNCIVGPYGPYWFEDGNEKSQTVNTERYVTILRKFCASLSRHRGINRDEQWFQHYGATHYTSNDSFAWLREWSQERLISRKRDVKWHCTHRTWIPRFYLWGYLNRAGLGGGATGAIAPGPPLQGGPRDDIYLF